MPATIRFSLPVLLGLICVGCGGTAYAQTHLSVKERIASMKTANPVSFDKCHAIAIQRGYNDGAGEFEDPAIMHFISGCIMGQQR